MMFLQIRILFIYAAFFIAYSSFSIGYILSRCCEHIINLVFYIILNSAVLCTLFDSSLMRLVIGTNIAISTATRNGPHTMANISFSC